jgi:surface antigen
MQQQAGFPFYRFQFLFASLFVVGFILLISAIVTAVGGGSVLDARTGSSAHNITAITPDSPNAVATGTFQFVAGVQRALLSTGIALYGTCRSVTTTAVRTDKAIGHGVAVAVRGTGHGIGSVVHGVGGGVMFTVHLPGKLLHPLASGQAVNNLIRPADAKPVPVIDAETSESVLASLSAQQQAQILNQISAQIAANKNLGGTVVAGDPSHGGYPAKWDAPVPQDSRLDSWGMYNRECVSYAAWKVYQTYGHMPYWGGVGNANQWLRDARRDGIPTGLTPAAHSVAISLRGYYGHAMWVEKVQGDMIYVSQYNYDLRGHYSEMWVNARAFTYIYFK